LHFFIRPISNSYRSGKRQISGSFEAQRALPSFKPSGLFPPTEEEAKGKPVPAKPEEFAATTELLNPGSAT